MENDLARIQRSPRDVARWRKAQENLLCGRHAQALKAYRELAPQFPGVAELWFELGNAAAGELDFALANEAYGRVMQLAPGNASLLVMVGQIKPQDEVNIAFRADGRLIERPVNLGDRIAVGNIVARIESKTEQNAVEGAEADVAAAQANLAQVEKAEARQSDLLKRGVSSRASYDQALQQLQAAQAQLDGASSRLRTSQSRAKYAELDADVGGTVTAVGATPGEFVRAGQMIVRVAREDRVAGRARCAGPACTVGAYPISREPHRAGCPH
jgi:multidrug efflux pump subunit AcrA (membrane-fusion protein)